MTKSDIRDAFERAAAEMPLDVERRLEDLHRGLPRRDRMRRAGVIAVAAAVAISALALVSLIKPADHETVMGSTLSGRIAFTRVMSDPPGDASADVVAVDVGSAAITLLSQRSADDFFPSWSPDGARLAFASGSGGAAQEIRVTNPDGSDPVTIDTGTIEFLSWSPDGGQLAYVHSRSGTSDDPSSGIYVVDADGGTPRRVHEGAWESVSWSPDGALLLVTGWPAANTEHACPPDCTDLYTVRLDGSDLTRLTDDDTYEHYAVWSPDGTRIAFARSPDYDNVDYEADIYLMEADGDGISRLTDWSGFDSFPAWSPDGTLLAFASDREVTDAQQTANADGAFANIGIYVMKPDGSSVRRLVAGEPDAAFLPSSWTP